MRLAFAAVSPLPVQLLSRRLFLERGKNNEKA